MHTPPPSDHFGWQRIGFILLALSLLLLSSCASQKHAVNASRYAAKPAAAPMMRDNVTFAQAPSSVQKERANRSPSTRKRHYNAYLKLRTSKPTALLDQVSKMITAADGYIEYQSGLRITFRVPEAHLMENYKKIQTMGDVLQKSLTVEDITAAFEDISLRLSIARKARDRLMELLSQAQKEEVKLKLLQEISRLNENIEQLQAMLSIVDKLAKYSKLTLEAVPRASFSQMGRDHEIDAFRWIHSLSPFRRDVAAEATKVEIHAPDGMVEIKNSNYWLAESADGAVFWSYALKTPLLGDQTFWIKALRHGLCSEFATCTERTLGSYRLLAMQSREEPSYYYQVGIRAEGTKLEVVEVYLPTQKHQQQYAEKIQQAIQQRDKP